MCQSMAASHGNTRHIGVSEIAREERVKCVVRSPGTTYPKKCRISLTFSNNKIRNLGKHYRVVPPVFKMDSVREVQRNELDAWMGFKHDCVTLERSEQKIFMASHVSAKRVEAFSSNLVIRPENLDPLTLAFWRADLACRDA